MNTMATCGTCKATGQTVAHIRACSGAPTSSGAPQLPLLVAGNVVTIDLEDGYWTVTEDVAKGDTHVWALRDDATRRTVNWPLQQVELVFADAYAASDWRIAQAAEAERERVSQALHGRPAQERGYYASKHEVRGDATYSTYELERDEVPGLPGVRVPQDSSYPNSAVPGSVWAPVDALRKRVAEHLHYETNQGRSKKCQGYFAVDIDGTLKFLRIKKMITGHYTGRVFVDSMGSATAYPVKSPATLVSYLTAVLEDPAAAAKRFADELDMCSDCGRPLTNKLSRQRGIGPDCWAKR